MAFSTIAMQTRVSQIDGKSIAQDSQHRDRLSGAGQIDPKAVPGEASGHHKSTENRSREPPRTAGGAQEHSRSYFGASWQRLGTSPARPGSAQGRPRSPKPAPGSALERAETTKIDAKSRRGAKNHVFFGATRSRSFFGAVFR